METELALNDDEGELCGTVEMKIAIIDPENDTDPDDPKAGKKKKK